MIKIVWGITGSGDLLPEVTKELEKLVDTGKVEITACLSKAAKMVVNWYKLSERIEKISKRVLHEYDANSPFIAGPLQIGKYNGLLVAPATANTVAKIVHGIADTLVTNAVAQAQKGGIEIIILPVDQKPGKTTTLLPTGEEKTLIMRDIDIENTEKLKGMKGIKVIEAPEDIRNLTLSSSA
jgi:archaeoflavoprotein AfpA